MTSLKSPLAVARPISNIPSASNPTHSSSLDPSTLSPKPNPQLSVFKRIYLHSKLLLLRTFLLFAFRFQRAFWPQKADTVPNDIIAFVENRRLKHRVFFPKFYDVSAARTAGGRELLPLYLDIHGGGFALCDPQYDDEFCSAISNATNAIVISLDYSKAPTVRFPIARSELIIAILNILDFSISKLPIDPTRVCIGGFSAGANLSLSCCMDKRLLGKIKGVVLFYPILDWSIGSEEKIRTRPYFKARDVDPLVANGAMFNYGYIPAGQDTRDPRVSPFFMKQEDVPEWTFGIGAEYDMLAHECGVFMGRIADRKWTGEETEEEGKYEWQTNQGRRRWWLVKGVVHGYTHWMADSREVERKRQVDAEKTVQVVVEWLINGPFKK